MKLMRRITRSRGFTAAGGAVAASYLRLVWKTNRLIVDPPDLYEQVEPHFPIIVAMWHGQHFMVPFIKHDQPNHRTKVLISRHADGELNAVAAERLGIGTIRGSGDHGGRFDRKGGVGAFKAMFDALKDGYNVAMTADVPKISRVAGNGVVKLASMSERPVYAVAIATSRRYELDNWDRSAVNLPFGTIAVVAHGPYMVPPDLDEAETERHRKLIEERLNIATARAYALADGKAPPPGARRP
jgi:lysophospholipid acyltransferase (LPLAT)-like uncharacterized protein